MNENYKFEPERSERVLRPFLRPERRPRHRLRGSGPAGAHLAMLASNSCTLRPSLRLLSRVFFFLQKSCSGSGRKGNPGGRIPTLTPEKKDEKFVVIVVDDVDVVVIMDQTITSMLLPFVL